MPLIVTASNATQVFGQPLPDLDGSILGLTNNDDITVTYSCDATTNSPVGTYPIVPVLVDPDDLETNYVVTLSNGTLTVTMAAPVLSWPIPSAISYGTALDTNQLDATANVPGTFDYDPGCGTALDPGTNTLSVLFTPADSIDYTSASASADLLVAFGPIPLNIGYVNNNVVLNWDDPASLFTLQSAPDVTCAFTNIPGAVSPWTNTFTNTQQFFQLLGPTN